MALAPQLSAPLPMGPRSYRKRLLGFGWAMGLLIPAAMMALAVAVYRLWPCSGDACVATKAGSWLPAALALPTALLVGLPFRSGLARYLMAGTTSLLVWALIGRLAARRAVRRPLASWKQWWGEYLWLLAAVWAGIIVALVLLAKVVAARTTA